LFIQTRQYHHGHCPIHNDKPHIVLCQ